MITNHIEMGFPLIRVHIRSLKTRFASLRAWRSNIDFTLHDLNQVYWASLRCAAPMTYSFSSSGWRDSCARLVIHAQRDWVSELSQLLALFFLPRNGVHTLMSLFLLILLLQLSLNSIKNSISNWSVDSQDGLNDWERYFGLDFSKVSNQSNMKLWSWEQHVANKSGMDSPKPLELFEKNVRKLWVLHCRRGFFLAVANKLLCYRGLWQV